MDLFRRALLRACQIAVAATFVLAMLIPPGAAAPVQFSPMASYPNFVEADFLVKDFLLANGEHLADAKFHYTMFGTPRRDASGAITNAVLLLHGTTGTGRNFLAPSLADFLFGPDQPLDATRFVLILPDGLGHGASSKPSDGLKGRFPHYGYGDEVEGQYRLLTEGLGIRHLKLVLGTSMGGMQTWIWGERHPQMMDALMPIASQPVAIAGRNMLWRRLIIDAIRTDPDWHGGNYRRQPTHFIHFLPIFNIMVGNAPDLQTAASTRAAADAFYDRLVGQYALTTDANDYLYWFESSADYDPSRDLEKITAKLVAVNFADDLLNPAELGVMEAAMRRLPNARYVLVPASPATHGHQTLQSAVVWRDELVELLK
ncbi:MAG TPA: alpha/beta fold hydrolase [Stellaceae bacterium]|nr:alpha/beta fold hydrolase [Stellaceae bacterium]